MEKGNSLDNVTPAIISEQTNVNGSDVLFQHFNVAILKEYIKSKHQLFNIQNIWKVEGVTPESEKWKILESSEFNINDIEQKLCGSKLDPLVHIGEIFPKDRELLGIDIIVELTTDQRTCDTANLGYVPRREGNLGGTLLCPDQLTSNTNEGISFTDKDTSKRPVFVKSLIDDLLDKRIILVQAPPYSGKTALTQLIEDYLINSAEYSTYRIIRFSTLWGNDVGELCNWENFGEAWKKILGVDWLGRLEPMDIDVDVDNKNITASQFWKTVNRGLQGSHDIYIIMFGSYSYGSNPRDLSIPIEIPEFNSKSIYDIKFTDNELEEYVTNFCRYFNLKEYNKNIIPEFIKYIKNATAGHVGFVRHILYYTREEMKSKVNELTWNKILVYLNSNGFNETINNCRGLPKIKSFSRDQIKLCENVLLNKKCPYQSSNNSVLALIKSGVLVIDKNYMLQFSAPIVMRSFIYQKYGNEKISETIPESLYDFIVDVFTAMCLESRELLQRTLSFGFEEREETVILEQMWQKEFYRIGKRLLNGYFMSCDVGATFASNGYLDFYVDEPFNWTIKILREERCVAKHAKHFDESTGIYKEITLYAESIAIVDIRSESIKSVWEEIP
ncbi:hypothetical protein C1645_838755 [Glomus cerebriforme]|uniref:AAA-ATPase-like domain-containing protein n=1 Tax=Glomus cerebriforme TaxID=658196 RepID=A0A397S1W3_9GLOM|nr:hypothetical protein C1645_838755 [Glomus cerebriforme]